MSDENNHDQRIIEFVPDVEVSVDGPLFVDAKRTFSDTPLIPVGDEDRLSNE